MSEFEIVPRTAVGLPAVVINSDGVTPRPPLHLEKWCTNHYTGNNIDYTNADVPAVIRQIQAIFSKTKPFEYNYVIGQRDDPFIYEFAGGFQAAHSAGENLDSFGILFLNGTMDPLTVKQVRKYQWLRDVLIYVGGLRPDVIELPHKQMPGAATACSGPFISTPETQWLLKHKYVPPTVDLPVGPPFNAKGIKMMNPLRIFDSRSSSPLPVGQRTITVPTVPDGATGVFVTITAVNAKGPGYATIWANGPRPEASCLNYEPGGAICNTTLVPIPNKSFLVYVSAETDLIFDLVGFV